MRRAEVLRAAVAGGAEVQLARLRLGVARSAPAPSSPAPSGCTTSRNWMRATCVTGMQIGQRIERLLAEVRIDREHVVGREQPGVAVGRALRHQVGADVLAAAGAVLDHHRLRSRRPAGPARCARAMVSGEPPGVSGTMILTGRSGKPCAAANAENKRDKSGQQPSAHRSPPRSISRRQFTYSRAAAYDGLSQEETPMLTPEELEKLSGAEIAVPVADPGAVRVERRVHAAAADARSRRSSRRASRTSARAWRRSTA